MTSISGTNGECGEKCDQTLGDWNGLVDVAVGGSAAFQQNVEQVGA
jgi:hypothetical protein